MKRKCICTLFSLLVVLSIGISIPSFATTTQEDSKKTMVKIPANAPRLKLLGAEFVLVEGVQLPEKILFMRNRWHEIVDTHEKKIFDSATIPLPGQHKTQWQALAKITKQSPISLKTLRNVNSFFNRIISRKDKDFYGKNEYWATPKEFISNRSGDCEDYAITKYFALQYFGWNPEHLWVVFLHDKINIGGHAVLVAQSSRGQFVLDNLSQPSHLLIPVQQYEKQVAPFALANHKGFWLRYDGNSDAVPLSRFRAR